MNILRGTIELKNATLFREYIRLLERKLGLLNESEMSCCGVTMAQCHAIVEIGREKDISLNKLSELLNLDNSTLSRTVNNLVNANLVTRELDSQDRRYVTISLTNDGKKIYEDIETGMNTYFKGIFGSIPDSKKEQVMESLEILLEAIDKSECCNGRC